MIFPRPVRGRLAPLLLAAAIGGTVSADPLHSLGMGRVWRHEHSGWLFPPEIAGLQRVGTPYALEGGNDVGARYGMLPTDALSLELEVHTGAEPGSPLFGERFEIEGIPDIGGSRDAESDDGVIRYRFQREQWTVRIRVSLAPQAASPDSADAAVRSLPWNSLGSAERLH